MRDVIDDGETEFHAMKDDLYDGVCDVCNEEYDDGLARMLATLNQAAILPLFPVPSSPVFQPSSKPRRRKAYATCWSMTLDWNG